MTNPLIHFFHSIPYILPGDKESRPKLQPYPRGRAMSVRHGLLWCCLLYLGIPTQSAEAADAGVQANRLWEQGQRAMCQGLPDEAIRLYEQSLAADAALQRSHLSLAAAFLSKKDEGAACSHLGKYLEAYPENLAVRTRYAELLAKLH